MPVGLLWRIARRRLAISFTPTIRGGNLRVFRSSIYRTNVSSSDGVNLCWLLCVSDLGVRSFIRLVIDDLGTSYVCAARRIDIFLSVRIAWMARVILASWDCVDIVLLWWWWSRKSEGRVAVGKWPTRSCGPLAGGSRYLFDKTLPTNGSFIISFELE